MTGDRPADGSASDTPDRPNIVLVTIDSLRADHCGFAGYERDTTPTLDQMAEEGLVFEHAIAPGPATPESMPAVFTGQYPLGEDARSGPTLESRRERIRSHMETHEALPERLSRLGYATAGFTPNPFTSRYFGFDDGFDRYEDFMDESRTLSSLYDRVFERFLDGDPVSSMGRVLLNLWQREEVFKPWESYADEALGWADAATEPSFLWVFLMDAHNPYTTGNGHRTQSRWKTFHANYRFWRESHETPFSPTVHDRLVTAYDDSVRYADAFLERLLSAVGDDTLVVVHGDHGEAFGEHGHYGHEPYLYEENVHVPLVVYGGPTGRVTDPVSLRSLPALLTDAARGTLDRRVPPGPDRPAAGPDADAPGTVDTARASGRPVCYTRTDQGGRTAVRGRTWKYVAADDGATVGPSDGTDRTRDGAEDTRDGADDTRDGAEDTRDGADDTRDGADDTRDGAQDTRDGATGNGGDGAAQLYDVTPAVDEPMDDPQLAALGATLVSGWGERRAELGRIRTAVAGAITEGDA